MWCSTVSGVVEFVHLFFAVICVFTRAGNYRLKLVSRMFVLHGVSYLRMESIVRDLGLCSLLLSSAGKRRNPTSRTGKDLNKLLTIRDKIRTISTWPQNFTAISTTILSIKENWCHTCHHVPKIHKPELPLRPVTSSIGASTYELLKHLVTILSPLQHIKYSVITLCILRTLRS